MAPHIEASAHHATIVRETQAYAQASEEAKRRWDHSPLYAAVAFLLEHLKDDKLQDSADFLSGQPK